MKIKMGMILLLAAAAARGQTNGAESAPRPTAGGLQPNFGTTSYSAAAIFSFGFQALASTDVVTNDGFGYKYMTSGLGYFLTPVDLPSGVVIDFIGLNYCDNNAGANWLLTLYDDFGDHQYNVVGQITPPDRTGCGYFYNTMPLDYQFDASSQHLLNFILVQNGATDGSIKFRGAEVLYKRKVSPDPAFATFTDVPVGNPQHRFVEALVAAGITAGCGGGNYCPNNPVTRGQMAVFLSVALGLHFPN